MDWKELYSKKGKKPGIAELSNYLAADVMDLFSRFANHLAREYRLHCAPAVHTVGDGWTFPFGRSGMCLYSGMTVKNGYFHVEGIPVMDDDSLNAVLLLAEKQWNDGFGERLAAHCANKSREQGERAKKRRKREKQEREEMEAQIDPRRFNRFRWSPKLPRKTLIRLYESDVRMIEDEELADEVGFTLYARCLQGRDERQLMLSGRMKCHHCGEILTYGAGILTCTCGSQYQFREYMRSFRENNMPANSAAAIFNAYIEKWPLARTYHEKMGLIDWLVHEFHLNLSSGVKGRFVGVNLIEGTKKQIEELILSLAGGEETRTSQAEFVRNLQKQ